MTDDVTVVMNSKALKAVEFSSSQPAGVLSSKHVVKLVHLLGLERPEVDSCVASARTAPLHCDCLSVASCC